MNGKYQIYLGRRLGGAAGWSCNRVLSYEASLPSLSRLCSDNLPHQVPHCTTCAAASGAASFVRVWKVYKCDKTRKFSNISSGLGWAPALLLPPHFYHCWQRPPGLGWAGLGCAGSCRPLSKYTGASDTATAWPCLKSLACDWLLAPAAALPLAGPGTELAAGSLARPHEVTARGCSE